MDPDQLLLGAFIGAQVLIVLFCVVKANAYRERVLLMHAAATLMAVLLVQSLVVSRALLPQSIFLLVLALAGLHLLDLVSHAGALRRARRWLLATSAGALPLLAAAAAFDYWWMFAGTVLWVVVVAVLLVRAWPQSKPWIWWLLPGKLALVVASASVLWEVDHPTMATTLTVAGLLMLWSACVYIATGWRGRIFGETRARINARNAVDPLTGLATPLVIGERVRAARNLIRRYGHPSVLMLVHIENLFAIASEFGPEAAEAAVLGAANRVRECLRDGDVAARLTHSRMAVLAEGLSPAEAAANVASRILVAGLKEPLAAAPAEFLRFRIVLAPIPVEDVPAKLLLHRMGARLDQELQASSERRILSLSHDDLLAPPQSASQPAAL